MAAHRWKDTFGTEDKPSFLSIRCGGADCYIATFSFTADEHSFATDKHGLTRSDVWDVNGREGACWADWSVVMGEKRAGFCENGNTLPKMRIDETRGFPIFAARLRRRTRFGSHRSRKFVLIAPRLLHKSQQKLLSKILIPPPL